MAFQIVQFDDEIHRTELYELILEYFTRIAGRTRGSDCPYCVGRRVGYGNSFVDVYPEIAKEWHPIKNGDSTPKMYTAHSNHKA